METEGTTEQSRIQAMKSEVKKVLKKSEKGLPGTSLMPIKGISSSLKSFLGLLGIFDVPGLLVSGSTRAERENLANRMSIDTRLVDSWVKQADLWRVPGMTTNIAYLLVLAGVRCVEDLAEVDIEKAFPIMKSIESTYPDFTPFTKAELEQVIIQAKKTSKDSSR